MMKRFYFTLSFFILIQGCATQPYKAIPLMQTYNDVTDFLGSKPQKVDYFFQEGPLQIDTIENFRLPLSPTESVVLDLFLPIQKEKSPLLIFQHGNKSSKDYHRHQAALAASWGFNAITVDQPNVGEWLKNGSRLNKLVSLLAKWPQFLKGKYNTDEIILVGHSFGGSAIAIASGKGAPVKGLIFLDPALVHKSVIKNLQKIRQPSILLGADETVFKSRRRQQFFKNTKGSIVEISIKGATHNDAQYPNMFSWSQTLGLSPTPTATKQKQFAAAIVASAFTLALQKDPHLFIKDMKRSKRLATKKLKSKQLSNTNFK